jgi:hypothetical protein
MKTLKALGVTLFVSVMRVQQAFAIDPAFDVAVPEIDGAGAIIGIGLVISIAVLIKEKFHR